MATIETASMSREVEMTVRFIGYQAERDVGAPKDAEVLSVRIGNVDITRVLPADMLQAIREDLAENHV